MSDESSQRKIFDGPYTYVRVTPSEDEKKETSVPEEVPLMINALKKMYKEKLKPFEEMITYDKFASAHLKDAYFDAKPFVLLIGQYSVGKTTFIRYLLERDFPGVRIGPEPTTDRFMVLMWGPTDRTIPGNALVADASKPFTQLNKFGMGFTNKFECAELDSPILNKISFIDTPGILSGEKQREGRGYDFPEMCEWFAGRCDRILLLFDAHKLDISDEMRATIEKLRANDDKIKVVLNKADIATQQLVRVYGALMWSLGKVFQTPEVLRVYVGSFWEKPLQNKSNEDLMRLEKDDLLSDLRSLPKNVAIRKVNEVIKRARKSQIHYEILLHIKSQFGTFGKEKKLKQIADNLGEQFKAVMAAKQIPKSDFPNIKRFKEHLLTFDFKLFNKKNKKQIVANLEGMLNVDMEKLMLMIPGEVSEEMSAKMSAGFNPFEAKDGDAIVQQISKSLRRKYETKFDELAGGRGHIVGSECSGIFSEIFPNAPNHVYGAVFALADIDKNGDLDQEEYIVARFLLESLRNFKRSEPDPTMPELESVPKSIPDHLIPPSKKRQGYFKRITDVDLNADQ